MIYLDSSLVLARLFVGERLPAETFWDQPLVSSRLLMYEVWSRINTRGRGPSHAQHAQSLLNRMEMLELTPVVLERALEPFPKPIRTLDALHLASIEFVRRKGRAIELASYDNRLNTVATALGIPLVSL